MAVTASCAALAITCTACHTNASEDITIGRAALREAGSDSSDLKVDANALTKYRGLRVNSSALADAGKHLDLSELITKVREDLKDFNEYTEGPVRDAVIETACDSVQSGEADPATIQSDLEGHLQDKIGPIEVQAIGAAEEMATQFTSAAQSGNSGKADVVLICYAADHPH